jgi:Cof subfamily protein (haloacid dehalogenase superfamily)
MKSKLVFFDIDGTLVSHAGESHVPEPTVEALKRLVQKGHVPAVATARNLALTRKTAAALGIDLLVCCNGAQGILKGKLLYETFLGEDFARIFRERARAENSLFSRKTYALGAENVYTDLKEEKFDAFILSQVGFDCKKPLTSAERIQLACVFAPFPLRLREWRERRDVDVVEFPSSTELRPPGVSKWSGIVRAAAAAGFGAEDLIAVGDGLNDVDMIQNASLGIAVGGAGPELKSAADFVARDIDEGGILSAFRDLGMI